MWPELSPNLLLDLCAVQGSASTISLLQVLSPSEKGPCGGPWGMDLCPIIFLSFMGDKDRLYAPWVIQTDSTPWV